MDDRLLLFLVLFPLLAVSGVALVHIGLSGLRAARLQEETERARAFGTVVDIVRHPPRGRGKPPSFHPVVEFEAEGRRMRLECPAGYWTGQFSVGEKVDLCYNADDPACFHLDKLFDKNMTGDRVTIAVGLAWIAASAVVAFFVSR